MKQSDTSVPVTGRLAHVALEVLRDLELRAHTRVLETRHATAETFDTHVYPAEWEADLINALREVQDALAWRDEVRTELVRRGYPVQPTRDPDRTANPTPDEIDAVA